MVVKRNLNTEKKVTKRQSRKVPFVLSTSLLAATFLAAGATVSADEHNGEEVKHGEIVSEVAEALPGSPEKGQIMSSIAQGDYELANEILNDLIDDREDLDEEDFEDLIPEDVTEETATEEEAIEGEAVEEVTEEEAVQQDAAAEEEVVEEEATEGEEVEEAVEEDALAETEQQLDAQHDEIVEEITEHYQSIFDRNEALLDYQDLYIEDQLVSIGVIDETEDAEALEEEIALITEDVEENLEEYADENSQDIQAEGNTEVKADAEVEVGTDENDEVQSDETTDDNASVAVIEADAEADQLVEDENGTVNDQQVQQKSSMFEPFLQMTNAYEKVKNSYASFISSLK